MRVILNDSIYEMNRKQFQAMLKIAKETVKHGIYAAEKDGVAEMKKDIFYSDDELKKAVAEYESKGFNVHYNL